MEKAKIMDQKAISRAVTRISHEIVERNKGVKDIYIIGIETKGTPLAKMIASKIEEIEETKIACDSIDITMYRDDITHEKIKDTMDENFNLDVENKTVVLVDDVLYTGRTIRAALDYIIDNGRPKLIQLAVLIDRGHRELPIRADYVGKNVPTSKSESVFVKFDSNDIDSSVIICE
ncbi:bifunctional pyr operon transcriptional regulator/uracil phosphoribosyltransferase PyrR [Peptostreptococcus russellii]|uniref:bifunctional pyr operon transcriptional regulator/uracil phosphoribosyltransferase PyrR n=1 Tax=Peptostreptococcus russellii TaxID=215200 RepID=UPI0016268869|nr:bifunctional pyr operon transcriptional regulator/uracil phosphoribosyltransferase PyrR [Peptostreptococcus russellii]MBC2577194.1 bifunctional pyr operon transcriptional regulator/uracil phosphoribosyltransferase PyrR [Peptostreptococcus russellii]